MHAKPDLRVFFEAMFSGSGSVIVAVMRLSNGWTLQMTRLITISVIAIICVGCVKRDSSIRDSPDKIALSCMIVRWKPEFLDSFNWTTDPPVLNEIETFFLIDHPAGTKSTPIELDANEKTRLTDTFGSGRSNEYVFAIGETLNESTQLTISPANGSEIKLEKNVTVELPKFGSTIIKTENSLRDNRCIYLWVMVRQ